nr:MAG TPA: hypothetical protein [Caudoviricetes sp.]
MKVVIDTKMGRHMLETTSDDALAVTQSIMEKYAEETQFLTLWEQDKNKTTTLRKSEIMAMLVYPDELHDYDKATIDMIQDAVIQKEKESEEEEPDFDVEMHFKDGSVVKAYTDEDGRMVFKPQKREV